MEGCENRALAGGIKPPSFKAYELVLFEIWFGTVLVSLHLLAFGSVAALLWRLSWIHPLLLILLAPVLWPVAALVFTLAVVLARKLLVGRLPLAARFPLTSPKLVRFRWTFNSVLMMAMWVSPFWRLVQYSFLLRQLFYRGMGAQVSADVFFAATRLVDPFNVRLGRRVLIGDEALILGHKVENGVVTLAPVEIEDDVLIGGRSVIMPGVKIGRGASVATCSVVHSGSVILAGETWAGNPAKRVDRQAGTEPVAPVRQEADPAPARRDSRPLRATFPDGSGPAHSRVQAVVRVCARILQRSPADLRPGMRFFEDLGMSSFQLLDLAMQLETECGVFVDEASLHSARTIGALAGLLDSPPGQGCPGSPEIAGHVGA